MEFTTIKYLKSTNPIEFLEKPDKETLELVARIKVDPFFKNLVKNLRDVYKFPKEGIDLTKFTGQNLDDLPFEKAEPLKTALYFVASVLSSRINLHESFISQMYLLVFFNSILNVSVYGGLFSDKVDYAVTKKEIAPKLFDYKHEVAALIIPYNITYVTFQKQTKKIWNQMQEEMSENLANDPFTLKIYKNTELAIMITELKENKNMTFAQIAEKLYMESDGSDDKLRSEEYIKDVYYGYNQLWKMASSQQEPKK